MTTRFDHLAQAGRGLLLVGVSLGGAGWSANGRDAVTPASVVGVESAGANALVATLRARFGSTHVLDAPSAGSRRRATVTLPDRARDAFELTATSSGATARITLLDATDAPSEEGSGFVVYRSGHGSGADVLHRLTGDGTEDYLAFERAPAVEEIVYTVDLGDGLAGARLFAGSLELLDAAGTPRLRMSPPYVIDAAGARHGASVAVSGCAFDSDPRPPWGRPVTPPGASLCTVHVGWSGRGVSYPALVDPLWSTSGDLVVPRGRHAVASLPKGRVMIVGGVIETTDLTQAPMPDVEIYDEATKTWSATGSLLTGRYNAAATVLDDGRVLVAGGFVGPAYPDKSVEIYDPATGAWSAAASLAGEHSAPSATRLDSGQVLVVGSGLMGEVVVAELYDPKLDTWAPTAPQTARHVFPAATLLKDGKVLIVGGANGGSFVPEVYDPVANTWTATVLPDAQTIIATPLATLLENGKVLVTEATFTKKSVSMQDAFLYDPSTNSWSATADLNAFFNVFALSTFASGKALVMGYQGDGVELGATEVYDPALATWTSVAGPTIPRAFQSATRLQSGQVLIAGGFYNTFVYPALTELFPFEGGSPCALSDECLSGLCAEGICCSVDCGGTSASSGAGGSGGAVSSSGAGGAGGSASPEVPSAGCGCNAAGTNEGSIPGAFALLAVAAGLVRRRRGSVLLGR